MWKQNTRKKVARPEYGRIIQLGSQENNTEKLISIQLFQFNYLFLSQHIPLGEPRFKITKIYTHKTHTYI